jgi:hypothetical protein
MATVTSAADGNWSNTATWSGAALPTQADTVKFQHRVVPDTVGLNVAAIDGTGTGGLVQNTTGQAYPVAVGNPRTAFYAYPVPIKPTGT